MNIMKIERVTSLKNLHEWVAEHHPSVIEMTKDQYIAYCNLLQSEELPAIRYAGIPIEQIS